MRVTGAMTFNQYWTAPQFQRKKPNLRGSKKQAFGDNIYFQNPKTHVWQQANSHHSFEDGGCNEANVINDTQTDRVLVSDDFIYWGGRGPEVPGRFLNYGTNHVTLRVIRNHRNDFPPLFIQEVVGWIRSLDERGYVGEPLDWSRSP
jgi:hypothetical protein